LKNLSHAVVVETKVELFVPKTVPNPIDSNKVLLMHQKEQVLFFIPQE